MKAIETEYQGYRFRSRLEARWAVFFDYLGIKWYYEHEGYETDEGWYLPDFYLPDSGTIVEIKATLGGFDDGRMFSLAKNTPPGIERAFMMAGLPGEHETPLAWMLMWIGRVKGYEVEPAIEAAKSARFEHGEMPITS